MCGCNIYQGLEFRKHECPSCTKCDFCRVKLSFDFKNYSWIFYGNLTVILVGFYNYKALKVNIFLNLRLKTKNRVSLFNFFTYRVFFNECNTECSWKIIKFKVSEADFGFILMVNLGHFDIWTVENVYFTIMHNIYIQKQ